VSFAAITLCVAAFQRVFIAVYFSPETFGYTLVCRGVVLPLLKLWRIGPSGLFRFRNNPETMNLLYTS
jgi:hypothetical protein